MILFQFQRGTIKRRQKKMTRIAITKKFQFQRGTIKRGNKRDKQPHINISIPAWYD